MEPASAVVAKLIGGITPWDALEREQLDEAMRWLASTDDVFRRVKPDIPFRHLVSYVVLVDPQARAVFLGRHRKAALHLPTGGHVEPGEHPLHAARREAFEELGIAAEFTVTGTDPLMLTISRTRGEGSHVDVSLWFTIRGRRDREYLLDPGEFDGGRWWDIGGPPVPDTDPHFTRFTAKLGTYSRVGF